MSLPALETQALSKSYSILSGGKSETLWAIKDLTLSIQNGEVVGIIGRNGAGKSTLLKILSRITDPTSGHAILRGRVSSLLEVGTGFHPELSGTDNVYVNGAILGMKRAEISAKFKAISEFAEIEKFMDMPIKFYSSGMLLRLAFAVAAHLEPEVLIVDEILAVGDIGFQKKCIEKTHDLTQSGRTVVLVSHQMNQIRKLCTRCFWLEEGRLKQEGPVAEVTSAYEETAVSGAIFRDAQTHPSAVRGKAKFSGWEISEPAPDPKRSFAVKAEQPFSAAFTAEISTELFNVIQGCALYDSQGQLLWGGGAQHLRLTPGRKKFIYRMPALPLTPGNYYWHVSLYEGEEMLDNWYAKPAMNVEALPLNHPMDVWRGILNFPYNFKVTDETS